MVYAKIIQRFTGYYIESESKEYKYRLYISLTYAQLSCGYDVGSQTSLIIDVGVKETTEARLNTFKRNLMMPSEAGQQNLGPLNVFLQHVLQTIFYFMKYQSQNIYFKNTPALLDIEWWPPKYKSQGLEKCSLNVGPTYQTEAQHLTDRDLVFIVC